MAKIIKMEFDLDKYAELEMEYQILKAEYTQAVIDFDNHRISLEHMVSTTKKLNKVQDDYIDFLNMQLKKLLEAYPTGGNTH